MDVTGRNDTLRHGPTGSRISTDEIPENLHPTVKFIFLELRRRKLTVSEMIIATGLTSPQLYRLWGGNLPRFDIVDRALRQLNFKLVIEDME